MSTAHVKRTETGYRFRKHELQASCLNNSSDKATKTNALVRDRRKLPRRHLALLGGVDGDGGVDEQVLQLNGLQQVRVPHPAAVLQLRSGTGWLAWSPEGITWQSSCPRCDFVRGRVQAQTCVEVPARARGWT